MSFPPARGYINNTLYKNIDYNLLSPLPTNQMCKGKPPGPVVLTVSPGDTINVTFHGSARHNGGICQFALSYDSDKSFFLIAEYLHSCPDSNFPWPVKIPYDAPESSHCTFAWTWVNAVGNREYYMNCADIAISRNALSPTASPMSFGPHCGQPIKVFNFPGLPTFTPQGATGGPRNATYIPFDFSCHTPNTTFTT